MQLHYPQMVDASPETFALSLTLAVTVRQAQRLPESPARLAIVGCVPQLLDALDDVTGSRRIGLDQAGQLADAAVGAGLASWGRDDAFQAGAAVRRWLDDLGVFTLAQLHDDEAEDFASFVAAA